MLPLPTVAGCWSNGLPIQNASSRNPSSSYMPHPAETRSQAGSLVTQRRMPSAPSVAV